MMLPREKLYANHAGFKDKRMKFTSIKIYAWLLLPVLSSTMIFSCKNNESKKADNSNHSQYDSNTMDNRTAVLRHFKLLLDTTRMPADTITVNVCYQEDSLTTDNLAYMLAAGTNDTAYLRSHKFKPHPKRTAPCLGKYIEIPDYQNVTRLNFSKDSSAIIIGQSMHDSPTSIDITLIKFGKNDYAYTSEHICGTIEIEYTKNIIIPHDILESQGREDGWHRFSNEQELLKQISTNAPSIQQRPHK